MKVAKEYVPEKIDRSVPVPNVGKVSRIKGPFTMKEIQDYIASENNYQNKLEGARRMSLMEFM